MFERPRHRLIGQLLEALDDQLLLEHRCYFGGGTAIALSHGEYRESIDVDFICSSLAGYRGLRELVSARAMAWAFKSPDRALGLAREPRVDQYGIRCAIDVEGTAIKFEVVFENRIELAKPIDQERICGVWTLSHEDMVATKLMANTDRWADDSVLGRDLVDLAMLTDTGELSVHGAAKARHAYGNCIESDLGKAKAHLLQRPGRLRLSMSRMGMTLPETELRMRIQRLALPSQPAPGPGDRSQGGRSHR